MASHKLMPLLAVLFLMLLPLSTFSDDTPPGFNPFSDTLCSAVECGKGTCKAGLSYRLGYICNCEPGWKQTTNDTVPDDQRFLPCIVPSCKLNTTCPTSDENQPTTFNSSLMNPTEPCFYTDCGGGTCTKTGTYHYKCTCKDGYANLLGEDTYPCYSKCALGPDCGNLWSSASSGNQATSLANFYGMTIMVMLIAMLLLKQ